MKYWQEGMLDDLLSFFEPNEDVLGLLLFGSLSQPHVHPDAWSDIDILIVVRDGALEGFFPNGGVAGTFRQIIFIQPIDRRLYLHNPCLL